MSGQARAWGWAAALRAGSTVPWQSWSGEAEPFAPRLPGAQQLALLRRLNLAAAAAGRAVPTATADRVLAGELSGRGPGDLPLSGAGDPRFGWRPVDPDTLSADELLRVAASLLADDVAALAPAVVPKAPSALRRLREARRPWQPAFELAGPERRVRAARESLAAQGLRPGGTEPRVYVLAADLGTLLADAWTTRAFDQNGPSWREFVKNFASSGTLPPRAHLRRMIRSAARRYDASRVTVVLDRTALAAELGVASVAGPAPLGADGADLVRRVGRPLGLLVPAADRPRLLRLTLGRRLAEDTRSATAPTVPARWEGWLRDQAERTREMIAADGYAVLGDLDQLQPGPLGADPVLPVGAGVLDLALGLLLDPLRVPDVARTRNGGEPS